MVDGGARERYGTGAAEVGAANGGGTIGDVRGRMKSGSGWGTGTTALVFANWQTAQRSSSGAE